MNPPAPTSLPGDAESHLELGLSAAQLGVVGSVSWVLARDAPDTSWSMAIALIEVVLAFPWFLLFRTRVRASGPGTIAVAGLLRRSRLLVEELRVLRLMPPHLCVVEFRAGGKREFDLLLRIEDARALAGAVALPLLGLPAAPEAALGRARNSRRPRGLAIPAFALAALVVAVLPASWLVVTAVAFGTYFVVGVVNEGVGATVEEPCGRGRVRLRGWLGRRVEVEVQAIQRVSGWTLLDGAEPWLVALSPAAAERLAAEVGVPFHDGVGGVGSRPPPDRASPPLSED